MLLCAYELYLQAHRIHADCLHEGSCNKASWTEFENNNYFFLIVLKPGNFHTRKLADLVSDGTHFLVFRWSLPMITMFS